MITRARWQVEGHRVAQRRAAEWPRFVDKATQPCVIGGVHRSNRASDVRSASRAFQGTHADEAVAAINASCPSDLDQRNNQREGAAPKNDTGRRP